VFAGLLLFTCAASAQERPNFSQLRNSALSDADRGAVRSWVQAQVQALYATEEPKQIIQQANELLFGQNGLVTVYKASGTARRFQVDLAEVLAGVFRQQYGNQPSNPEQRKPLASSYLVIALKEFAAPSATLDAFQDALSAPSASVRAVAAEGIAEVRQRIPAQAWEPLLGKLQVAGSQESNSLVLGAIYRALSVDNDNRQGQAAETMLKILDARFEQFAEQNAVPSAANADAIDWLTQNAGQIGDNQMYNRITLAAAKLLTHAVYSYTQMPMRDTLEKELEQTIYHTEERLETLYSAKGRAAVPRVREIMRNRGELEKSQRHARMLDELVKWIGGGETSGILNEDPFNFAAGLGISPPQGEQG
jgi:hypothetical protein